MRRELSFRQHRCAPSDIMHLRALSRAAEFALLFVVLPAAFYLELVPLRKIIALILVTGACGLILWRDADFNFSRLSYRPPVPGLPRTLLIRTALVALALLVLTLWMQPDQLFAFPRRRPMIWGIVMILYPFLSALSQEFIYRTFFFHRYRHWFGSGTLMVAVSAASFGFLHIIYDNPWAVLLSLAGGYFFADTYRRSRSLYWATAEHAAYGCLVFTIGLGNFFYEGF